MSSVHPTRGPMYWLSRQIQLSRIQAACRKHRIEDSHAAKTFKISIGSQSTSHKPRPATAIPLCTGSQSLCSFMNRIVISVHLSPCEGYLAFLPKLYRERNDDACLKHAILSVSYLTLSREHKSQKLEIQAQKNHGLSLGLLKTALESQESVVIDEILTACLLLSVFYVCHLKNRRWPFLRPD
jgi:hypothetical protein